jgi:two-component system response regulator (stage 0 sporulation protein F)
VINGHTVGFQRESSNQFLFKPVQDRGDRESMMANILVVDDQLCVRKLLAEELMLQGHKVSGIGDAESARRYLQSFRPDLVLLDLYIDGPQGFRLLEDIKCQHPDLPVIIVTAYDSFADDPRVSRANAYVIKSIHLDTLKEKIAQALRRQESYEEKWGQDGVIPNLA